jgi:DNA polymerase-3 subunit epsilon
MDAIVSFNERSMKPPIDPGCFPTGLHYPGIAHLLRVAAIGVPEEFSVDTEVIRLPIVAIDTETTGRDTATDRIVEVAAVLWDGTDITDRLSWLVNPGRPIPKEASDIHGISDTDVASKPTFSEILPELMEALSGRVPLAYNAQFDRQFLTEEFNRSSLVESRSVPAFRRNVEWLDPLVWVREVQSSEKSKSLGEVCQRLGIPLANAHRATDDAEAALKVLLTIIPDPRIPRTYAAFLQEQRRLGRRQDEERARWRRERAP